MPKDPLSTTHPDLARRIVPHDRPLGDRFSAGSAKTVHWICPKHPETPFPQEIRRLVLGMGCCYCSGHRVLAGLNDLRSTHPELAEELDDPELGTSISAGSNKKVQWRCANDHTWMATVANRTSKKATGCPECSGRQITPGISDLATKHPDLAAELLNPEQARGIASRSHKILDWRCPRASCGAIYGASPANRTARRPKGCPTCANKTVTVGTNDLATTHPELTTHLVDPTAARRVVYGTGTTLLWKCAQHPDHPFVATPRTRSRSGCGICNRKVLVPGLNDLATTHPQLVAQLVDPEIAQRVTAGSSQRVTWRCAAAPAHTWTTFVYGRTGAREGTGCPECFGTKPSKGEDALADTIQRLVPNLNVLRSDRKILNRRELDIVVPDLKIAFEFNGVYWHSEEAGTLREDHANKTTDCALAGFRLIHVWEDDWNTRSDVITRMIAHRLDAVDKLPELLPDADPRISQRIYARKLLVTEVGATEARAFLNANHIQGAVTCTRYLALKDDEDVIRALMGIRSPRSNARMKRATGEWEIRRYATLGTVPGGFTRLMRHAERTLLKDGVQLGSWVSFSDNEISNGALYRGNGFIADKRLPPDYAYVGRITHQIRQPKESYQRKRFREDPALLWDESWTEAQAARENGIRRTWDCGKIRWVRAVG